MFLKIPPWSDPLLIVSPPWAVSNTIPPIHPGGNPGANLKSISHRRYLFDVAFVWELTKETIHLPLGCLQGGVRQVFHDDWGRPDRSMRCINLEPNDEASLQGTRVGEA